MKHNEQLDARVEATDLVPGAAGEATDQERRAFLIGLGKWSRVVVAAAIGGAALGAGSVAKAGWINRRGGGGWANAGGGGSWANAAGGGGWVNRRSGFGGSWINR